MGRASAKTQRPQPATCVGSSLRSTQPTDLRLVAQRIRALPSEGEGRAFKSRRDDQIRKVPLEWPATRLENGWAPQGVAFEPSAFRQHRCGRSRVARTINHAQILKRQRGLAVNRVPLASQVRVLLCARVRSSMAEPCGATAQTRVRFLSAAPMPFAWEANLVKVPR